MFEKISVIGLGYIGLPTAAAFASMKKKVVGVDVNAATVETINKGEIHIVEPHLDLIVHAVVTNGFLKAQEQPEAADAFIVAVPTPIDINKTPDLSYLVSAIESIAPHLEKGNLVVIESTLPVGTTEVMAEILQALRPDLWFPNEHGEGADIQVAHCPERVLPGHVVRELVENDRLIGGISPKCADAAKELYSIFVEGDCVVTSVKTAELSKLAENSYRDINIAYANELSMLCDDYGIDVWELIELANRHPRVDILKPGAGVGGHCIAVDPWFIVSQSPQHSNLIRTAREVNNSKPAWIIEKVVRSSKALLEQRNVDDPLKLACLGVTFKPDIDDVRESPALAIVSDLSARGEHEILVVEPNLNSLPDDLENCRHVSLKVALEKADIILLLVAHSQFSKVNDLVRSDQTLVSATR